MLKTQPFRMQQKLLNGNVISDLIIFIQLFSCSDAAESCFRLRLSGVEIKFVTNTSKESRQILFNRLKTLGFDLQIDEIFSSVWAARDHITKNKLNPMLLVADKALDDFKDACTDAQARDSVVIGLAPEHFCYNRLNEAFRYGFENGSSSSS